MVTLLFMLLAPVLLATILSASFDADDYKELFEELFSMVKEPLFTIFVTIITIVCLTIGMLL